MKLTIAPGKQFGLLTVVSLTEGKPRAWLCRCVCGKVRVYKSSSFYNFVPASSCGCSRGMTKIIDASGQRFGRVVALESVGLTVKNERTWRCQCDCGEEVILPISVLRRGKRNCCVSCGQRKAGQARSLDVSGQKFGRLTPIEFTGKIYRKCRVWRCICDCGKETEAAASHLVQGVRISCGCAMYESAPTVRRDEKIRRRMLALQNQRRARELNADGSYTEEQVNQLFFKQKAKCANCFHGITMDTLHRDHKKSLSRGGSNHIENIQLLCAPCNLRKNVLDDIEFAQKQGRLL